MREKFAGIAKVGEKGQIVIPKEIREMFDIKTGDCIIVLADINKGITIVRSDILEDVMDKVMPEVK